MQFIVPGRGQFVPNGTKNAVPFDAKDPFIFHSFAFSDFQYVINLVKEDAALAPLYMTHSFEEYGDVDDSLLEPWIRAGVGHRGDIQEIDDKAGDSQYIFTTPGYVYSLRKCTLAFRLSNLLSRGRIRFRAHDLQGEYLMAQTIMNTKMNSEDPDDADWAAEEFEENLRDIVDMGTIDANLSMAVTPDYIRTRAFDGSPFSEMSKWIIKDYMNGGKDLPSSISASIREKWEALLETPYSRLLGLGAPETLFNEILPVRSAEMVWDPNSGHWIDMNLLTGNNLSGLGRMFLKANRRRLIPGNKHRR